MKKFGYDMMITPYPIKLSVGTLRKPTLEEIFRDIGYEQYQAYEAFSKLTPELFYTKMDDAEGLEIWESFSDQQKEEITLFNVVKSNNDLLQDYLNLFNVFFEENVIFAEGFFVWLDKAYDPSLFTDDNSDSIESLEKSIVGVISNSEMFNQVLQAIQQICCAYEDTDDEAEVKFKNSIAEKLYKKMKQAEKKRKQDEKESKDYSIPNIISAVSNNHPTISPINVYQLTVFQLIDAFRRRQTTFTNDMNALSVSVWGDKDHKYNANVWFLNEYEK